MKHHHVKQQLFFSFFIKANIFFVTCIAVNCSANKEFSPSKLQVPIGDLPGWKQIFYDDFTKDAAPGSWQK